MYEAHQAASYPVGILVARYLRASLTVGGQPAEARGGRGSDGAQGVLPPLALSIFLSPLTVTKLRLADILRPVYQPTSLTVKRPERNPHQ
jgi:hypothetical protein